MSENERLLDSAVIRIQNLEGKTVGTGFLVSPECAITCAHVVGMAGTRPGSLIFIKFDRCEDTQVAWVDETHYSSPDLDDVAFLRITDAPQTVDPLPLAETAKASEGHNYKCYGYAGFTFPAGADKQREVINGLVPADQKGAQDLLSVGGKQWEHGLSGAPIFDINIGQVVGMVKDGNTRATAQVGYCVSVDTMRRYHPDLPKGAATVPGLPALPPPGALPNYGPLPPGSNLPLPINKVFTGRADDLHRLADALLYGTGQTIAVTEPVATAGMGGIGKTQLASEFCHRYGQFCEGVHWINAANPDSIGAEIAACGTAMRLKDWPEKQPDQIEATLYAWAHSKRRIVVLDNLEHPEALAKWLPRLGSVRIIITTRVVKWPGTIPMKLQRLGFFQRSESLDLLRSLAPRLNEAPEAELNALAALLYDLPLAVDLAGRYLNDSSLTPAQYIEELRKTGPLANYALNDEGENEVTGHLKSLEATFELSWWQLEAPEGTRRAREMELARLAFRCAGYCAPAVPIPVAVLSTASRKAVDPEQVDANFNTAFDLGLARACTLGLLEAAEGGVSIHPLLAEFARKKDAEMSQAERGLHLLMSALLRVSKTALDSGLPAVFQPLRPHLESAPSNLESVDPQVAGGLINNLAAFLHYIADHSGAKKQYEWLLGYVERIFGKENPFVAITANNLGTVLVDLGDLAAARTQIERALAIDEQVYGPEHPSVATDASNLGTVLKALGDLAGARTQIERALAIFEKVLGPDHPNVGTLASNLGNVLKAQGNLVEARAQIERALAIDERVYGKEHPKVATDASNLGNVLQELGDLAGARAHYERALNIDERVYGNEHPMVANRIWWLGTISQAEEDLDSAKICYERALAIYTKFLPEGHPNITSVRDFLEAVEAELRAKG